MRHVSELSGPWTLQLDAVGDLEAAAAAGERRIAIGLAQPGEGDRIRASGPPARLGDGPLPGAVPGNVHLDLLAARLLADPFLGMHESEQHWIARCAWTYATRLPAPSGGTRHELVLTGVDTDAEIRLDGDRLATVRNAHRTVRVDVTDRLRADGGRLELRFAAQAEVAEARLAALGPLPSPYLDPIGVSRRMACSFGWDWGPTLLTAGTWDPVRLEAWTVARLDEVRLSATVPRGVPRMTAVVRVAREPGTAGTVPLRVAVEVAGARAEVAVDPEADEVRVELAVPGAARWWPRSHGEPVTYPATIRLLTADGTDLDAATRTVGFREVRLRREADATGESFAIEVNGQRIWVRGANWIPEDVFPSRVTPERIAARLADATAANIDLLRVWGGGRYESEAFYEACDRAGVLVWQDFLFACAAYPEDAETRDEVEAEAREAIARLGSHPSLAIWNGGNETIWGWWDWGWPEVLGDRPWGLGYWLDLLPRLVAELDPDRPYWPNSPWSGSPDRHVNDDRSGTSHLWEVWNDLDWSAYRERRPRFAAEFGYQAPAAWRTLLDAVGPGAMAEDAPAMLAHQKAGNGRAKLRRAVDRRHPDVHGIDDWLFFSQLEQARALRTAIGHLRGLGERCSGSIVWQLNDLWPVISWSLVDAAGRRKPAWYAVREAYADRTLTIEPALEGEGLDLVLSNESEAAWQAIVDAALYGADGPVPGSVTAMAEVAPRSTVRLAIGSALLERAEPRRHLLVARTEGATRAVWTWVDDRDLALGPARFRSRVTGTPDGAIVEIDAETLVRELCLFPDRLDPDATVDRMLLTLLPGETAVLRVQCPRALDLDALVRPPVLRAANDGVRLG